MNLHRVVLTVGKEMQRILLIGSRHLFYLNFRTLLSKPLGKKFARRNQMLLPTELVMSGTQCYLSKIKICRIKFSKAGSRQWSNSHCNYTAHWSWASNGVHLISWYRYKRTAKCLICHQDNIYSVQITSVMVMSSNRTANTENMPQHNPNNKYNVLIATKYWIHINPSIGTIDFSQGFTLILTSVFFRSSE